MLQKQKALITAKLVVEADDLESAEQFVDHLARKSHITITERSEAPLPTEDGDRMSVHLSVERRPCWGNWSSDIRRDVEHSVRRSTSTASCKIITVGRTIVETRTEEEAQAAYQQRKSKFTAPAVTINTTPAESATAVEEQPESIGTTPTEPVAAREEREFGLVDMLMEARDYDEDLHESQDENEPDMGTEWPDVVTPVSVDEPLQ